MIDNHKPNAASGNVPFTDIEHQQQIILGLITKLQQNLDMNYQLDLIYHHLKENFSCNGLQCLIKFNTNENNISISLGSPQGKTYKHRFSFKLNSNIEITLFLSNLTNEIELKLNRILSYCMYSIYNAIEINSIKSLTLTDPLTLVGNKQCMWNNLHAEINLAGRYNSLLTTMLVDLDNFKIINDTLGHKVGDQMIVSAAQTIQNCLRHSDSIYRFGGDEFFIILRNTNIYGAYILGERITSSIRSSFKEINSINNFKCSASIGIGIFLPNDTEETLFNRADRAMYRAKKTKDSVSF